MSFDCLTSSNPVAVWWWFLIVISGVNIGLWVLLRHQFTRRSANLLAGGLRVELMLAVCAAYVFGCTFRSVLPRADLQRICLFDTWLSSVAVGRSVATVAEVCFAIQWAVVLRQLSVLANSETGKAASTAVVPLIVLAECFSWYAVLTTNFLGSAIENSIWALTFGLVAAILLRLVFEFNGPVRLGIGMALAGIVGYIGFLIVVDVPMYLGRWHADVAQGKALLDFGAGLQDASTRWVVTQDIDHWKEEIAWMSLYFSVAVWSSLALCSVELVRDHLPRYRVAAARPLAEQALLG